MRRSGTSAIFAALGDETRLRLVSRLSDSGPQSMVRLTVGARVTRQAVAKHLRTLARAGLVRSKRQGRETVWRLEPPRLEDARRYLDEISSAWDGALARLKQLVEQD